MGFAQKAPIADGVGEVGGVLAPNVVVALDALRSAITVFDACERLTYASQHFNHMFRNLPHRETLIGLSYEEMIRMEIAHGELADAEAMGGVEAFIAARRGQFRDGVYAPRDVRLADGRILEIKTRRTPDGGWIALWSDATQARHLLSRFEDTVELSADAFAFWDGRDRLIHCNDGFAKFHGLPVKAMQGQSFEQLLRASVARGRYAIDGSADGWIERRLEAHRAPAGALTVVTAAGAAFLVRDRATRDGGRATVFTDVTDHHRVEIVLGEQTRALETTRKALEKSHDKAKRQASYLSDLTRKLDAAEAEADTAKTALLRTMSHELKTPLNAIIGFSDLLKSAPGQFKPEQIGEYAGLIHLAGHNLLRLINQILDLTKIAAGRFALKRAAIPAGATMWAASDSHSVKAEEKNIAVEIDCEQDLMVDADEAALTSMLSCLIDNAVSFTQAGGQVRMSAERGDGVVRIAVSDNGPGVPQKDLARILEPFEQVGRGTADHAHGAGLGLPLVKALVELHGGSLTVTSGDGFTAVLELPAA
ncbi:MAG TPA: PAS-domain containing protein [Rhizomicrobium sp.]|jgi:signal transduction histidine kinase|nr:PAS-domain containing protein [Rhizomicrobium sp.]